MAREHPAPSPAGCQRDRENQSQGASLDVWQTRGQGVRDNWDGRDDAQAPRGGFKYSLVGREYGRYGIEAFLETKAILES